MQAQAIFPKDTTQLSRVLSPLLLRAVFPDTQQTEPVVKSNQREQHVPEAQEVICSFFIKVVKQWTPDLVLFEFKNLFINAVEAVNSAPYQAVHQILASNNDEEFIITLKRCCYILLNNWIAARQYKPTQELIKLISNADISDRKSHIQKTLSCWLTNFVNSKDYQELKLFVAKYENREKEHWKSRYTSYLLTSQYADSKNPEEQRQAAKVLSNQLQEKFKFDLAMYTARTQPAAYKDSRTQNPTALGDEALRLIKKIVAKRGPFSYANLANIFLKQTQDISYKDFKQSLLKYLIYSEDNKGLVETLRTQLGEKLESLYEKNNGEKLNNNLLLKTCNRIIEYLTTEKQGAPSSLFVSLASQGNPLTLAIILLKIILICKNSRTQLEVCIAKLIQYYEGYSQEECHWVIKFLEVTKIILAIYTENVRYNLVDMKDADTEERCAVDGTAYRVFSQSKGES